MAGRSFCMGLASKELRRKTLALKWCTQPISELRVILRAGDMKADRSRMSRRQHGFLFSELPSTFRFHLSTRSHRKKLQLRQHHDPNASNG
mmetsp:Transcript_42713/g.76832  ORF Transcript_42713/g.76832 Transcript_42713/m.76832 type:complete len:91 (-) Transcript_42713:37-309(-)